MLMNFKHLLIFTGLLSALSAAATENVKVYFNNTTEASYTEPYRQITRYGHNFEQIMIDEIEKAQASVDVAIHDFNLPNLAKSLAKKALSGVKVRVVFENGHARIFKVLSERELTNLPPYDQRHYLERLALIDINQDGKASAEELKERDAIKILNLAKIPYIDDTVDGSSGTGIMHHKFIVIDGKTVVQASANFTISDTHGDMLRPNTRGNRNALMTIHDQRVAKLFSEEFVQLWQKKFGLQKSYRAAKRINVDGTVITVQFSPSGKRIDYSSTSNGLIQSYLENAQKSVNLALFVFSEQNLVNTLYERHNAGVKVSTLIEPTFAYREYSELLDMFGIKIADENCQFEVNNTPWKVPSKTSGVPVLPRGDFLHHKFGIIDDQYVVFGSHNWSSNANNSNDEAVIIVESLEIAKAFKAEHNDLMSKSQLGAPEWLMVKVKESRDRCGKNGIEQF